MALGAFVLSVGIVTAGLAVAGSSPLLAGHPAVVAALVVGFAASDRWPLYFELRDEAASISLSDVVVSVGVFFVSPAVLLGARLLGRWLADVGLPREPLEKLAVNLGLMFGETSVALLVFAAVGRGTDAADPRSWLALLAALVASSVFDAVVLALVMRVVIRRWELDVAAAAAAFGIALTGSAVGLTALVLAELRPAAIVLMLPPATVVVVLHRVNARLVNEGRRARGMHELASSLARVPELDRALVTLVSEARAVTRTERARLTVVADMLGQDELLLRVDADGPSIERSADRRPSPRADAAIAAWHAGAPLTIEHLPDGLLAPVHDGTELLGAVEVVGRRQGRGPFGPPDHTVLAGITGHLASTISRARLRDRLRSSDAARAHLESHDALTGLGNRRWFDHQLADLVAEHGARPIAIVLLNLKGFRGLNEDLGHAAGDRLLVAVAERLAAAAGVSGRAARLGSDEFAVAASTDDAVAFQERLVEAVGATIQLQGRDVQPGVAAGSATWPTDGADVGTLLRRADLALDVARQHPHTDAVAFDTRLEEAAQRRRRIVNALPAALEDGHVHVVFQPVVELASGDVVGVEALARWEHPVLGRVRPDEFVRVAEEQGIVDELTTVVLDATLAQARRWADRGLSLEVAVNISAQDLVSDRLVATVERQLLVHGVEAAMLTLEVTETETMVDPVASAAVLGRLRGLGVSIAIDDFGTGQSSLAYLRDLSASVVKIDRSFVTDVAADGGGLDVVRTVVELASGRGMTVVAEGIEDEQTYAALRELGVDRGQGYLMARPMPADEVSAFVHSGAAGRASGATSSAAPGPGGP